MSQHEALRDGAELYRAAAERAHTRQERDHLLDCAADLAGIADWISENHSPHGTASEGAELREVYASENGDCWHLARDVASGRVFVRHTANQPSGGHVRDIELQEFLSGPGDAPERVALTRLMGNVLRGATGSRAR